MDDVTKRAIRSTAYRIREFDDDIHMTPQDDWFDHIDSPNCPCSPVIDPLNKVDVRRGLASKYVWVHKQVKYHQRDLN